MVDNDMKKLRRGYNESYPEDHKNMRNGFAIKTSYV